MRPEKEQPPTPSQQTSSSQEPPTPEQAVALSVPSGTGGPRAELWEGSDEGKGGRGAAGDSFPRRPRTDLLIETQAF